MISMWYFDSGKLHHIVFLTRNYGANVRPLSSAPTVFCSS